MRALQTPVGPEGSGIVLREIGTNADPATSLDHVSLCHKWQLLDMEAGSMVSGSRFYYLKHELALLELALVQFAMAKLVRRGYTPVLPPDLVKSQYVAACGFQPRDLVETSQVYHVANTDLSLAGTAEIPLAAMYTNAELGPSLAERPVKHVAFGHAFRTEAGGQGLVRFERRNDGVRSGGCGKCVTTRSLPSTHNNPSLRFAASGCVSPLCVRPFAVCIACISSARWRYLPSRLRR